MLTLLLILSLGASAPSAAHPSMGDPRTLQCTAKNTVNGKDRKCHVKLPRGTKIRVCTAADQGLGHCALDARLVAWTASGNGAHCVLSKKKTDWKKRVTVKVAKDTRPGAGSCTLFVSVQ